MPYVRIEITDGATYEQKLELYKGVTDLLVKVLNKKPEYTFVVIEEVDNKSWGHMGTSVHEIRMAQAAGIPIPAAGQKADVKAAAAAPAPAPAAKPAPAPKAAAKKAAPKAKAPVKRGPAKK